LEALFTHLETSSNANIDLNHWRSCYHQPIETLRKEAQRNSNSTGSSTKRNLNDEINKCLNGYLDEGFLFFGDLIEQLEIRFLKFKVNTLFTLNNHEYLLSHSENFGGKIDTCIKTKDMKFALMCAHRSLISLGDLARYKEMIFGTSVNSTTHNSIPSNLNIQRDYSLARSYYLKVRK
jgi:hypothetical protein